MSATVLAPASAQSSEIPRWIWMLPLFGGIALMGAMTAPLAMAVYGLLLLGVAHNVSEIRYLALRWGDHHLLHRIVSMLAGLIGCIAMTRLLSIAGWVSTDVGRLIEIGMMYVILGVAAQSAAVRGKGGWGVLAIAAMLSFMFPQWHVMVFAHLHNVLPWWFVREAVPPESRRYVDWMAGMLLVAIPLLLLAGIGDGGSMQGGDWVAFSRGLMLPEWSGTLLGERVLRMFAYAQLVHFLIWVLLMPRLVPASTSNAARPILRRVDPWLIAIAVIGAGVFAWDFATTRLWYPVVATWHAYLELPVMVTLMLSGQTESGSLGKPLE